MTHTFHIPPVVEKVENTSGYEPAGFALIVKVPKDENLESATKSGIIIPQQQQQRIAMSAVIAQVVAIGPCAWREEPTPRCGIGDWILMESYAGKDITPGPDGIQYRIINDIHVIAKKIAPQGQKGTTHE